MNWDAFLRECWSVWFGGLGLFAGLTLTDVAAALLRGNANG